MDEAHKYNVEQKKPNAKIKCNILFHLYEIHKQAKLVRRVLTLIGSSD